MKTLLILLGCSFVFHAVVLPAAEVPGELQRLRADAARNPADTAAQKKLAVYCMKEHLEQEAMGAAEAAVVSAPADADAHRLYVTALARNGRYQEALDACQTDSWKPAPDDKIRKIIDSATLALQAQNQLSQADLRADFLDIADTLKRGVASDPDNLAIRLTLGWVFLDKMHDPRSAYPLAAYVARRHPRDENALKLFASACYQTGRLPEAVTAFRQALHLEPDDLWIRVSLGRALARTGRWSEAENIYAEVLQADPANTDARLGQAELAAWRGRSGRSLKLLQEVRQDNPTNVEAITLSGDVHRWNWDLSEARQDYQQALVLSPNNVTALSGLDDVVTRGSPDLHGSGYQFTETTQFRRESEGGGLRVGLSDRLYLLGDGAYWRFTQPNFTNLERLDGQGGLEYHWARWLETTVVGGVFDYKHQEAFAGGQGSAKLTPFTGLDIYGAVAYNQPFVSSLATVTNSLKQSSAGGGLDWKIGGRFSVQDSFEAARISDHNSWWEDKPQLSYRVFGADPGTFLRVRYDYLNYQNTNGFYFSPQHWSSLGPVLDTSIPLGNCLHLDAGASAPYVFKESKFGAQFEGGPALDLIHRRLQLKGSYIYSSIPGDEGNWSGHGWLASLKCVL